MITSDSNLPAGGFWSVCFCFLLQWLRSGIAIFFSHLKLICYFLKQRTQGDYSRDLRVRRHSVNAPASAASAATLITTSALIGFARLSPDAVWQIYLRSFCFSAPAGKFKHSHQSWLFHLTIWRSWCNSWKKQNILCYPWQQTTFGRFQTFFFLLQHHSGCSTYGQKESSTELDKRIYKMKLP